MLAQSDPPRLSDQLWCENAEPSMCLFAVRDQRSDGCARVAGSSLNQDGTRQNPPLSETHSLLRDQNNKRSYSSSSSSSVDVHVLRLTAHSHRVPQNP